jgi:hypothetical protein
VTTLAPSAALLWVVTTAIGAVMVVVGLRQGVLRHRGVRRCPSCGRLRGFRGCGCGP